MSSVKKVANKTAQEDVNDKRYGWKKKIIFEDKEHGVHVTRYHKELKENF